MNTKWLLGAAFAIALNCTTVNAQVLGGNAVGGLGGSLGGNLSGGTLGGLGDMSVIGEGRGQGSYGADLDTGSLRSTTDAVAGRTRNRVRDTAGATREHTRATLGAVRETGNRSVVTATELGASAAATARAGAESSAATAVDAAQASANAHQIDSAANVAGTLASGVDVNDNAVKGALEATHANQAGVTAPQPALDLNAISSTSAGGSASASEQGVAAKGSADGSASASVNR